MKGFSKDDPRINRGGRPKGSKNKSTEELRLMIQSFFESNFDKIQTDFSKLKPAERLKFLESLIKHVLPEPFNPGKLSPEQLDQVINYYSNLLKHEN